MELRGYQASISKAIGVVDVAIIREVEELMRDVIFHSTLDWQTARQFNKGAREAYEVFKYSKRVSELEAQGLTTSDAQGVVDAEYLKQA